MRFSAVCFAGSLFASSLAAPLLDQSVGLAQVNEPYSPDSPSATKTTDNATLVQTDAEEMQERVRTNSHVSKRVDDPLNLCYMVLMICISNDRCDCGWSDWFGIHNGFGQRAGVTGAAGS
ncbi:hypothetical protein LTR65_002855 [Meristemomyces frigidus]